MSTAETESAASKSHRRRDKDSGSSGPSNGSSSSHHHRKEKKSSKSSSSSSSSKKDKKKDKDKDKKKMIGGIYSLGDVLGRGGFGVVYKGMNVETGEFVALKQISLKNCTKDQVSTIKSEIDLLQKLSHKHIVRYIDNKETKNKLNIVLEFVENGSLQDIVKKFGAMKEELVAKYIYQVLKGLEYLHNEGVIHRDIKGANILTTNDGTIKLADFGVAATLNDVEKDNPVGTPYWMAPEIIELNPATPKSDIWSVGCTVIELLTGDPPYFDLAPMPALYRIVQDQCPPIPECSKNCRGFLMECFQKDPFLRWTADKLVNHPFVRPKEEKPEPKPEKKPTVPAKVKVEDDSGPVSSLKKPLNPSEALAKFTEDDEDDDDWGDDDWGDDDGGKGLEPNSGAKKASVTFAEPTKPKRSPHQRSQTSKNLQVKNVMFDNVLNNKMSSQLDDDDDDDDWGDDISVGSIDLASKLESKMRLNTDESDDDNDVFQDALESAFNDIDSDFTMTKRDEEMKLEQEVSLLVGNLDPQKPTEQTLETCSKLLTLLQENPDLNLKSRLTQNSRVLSLMEMLNVSEPEVILSILHIVNQIVKNSPGILEVLCLVGILPTVMRFSNTEYSTDIRMETCTIIHRVVHAGSLTMQMFIACRGLPVLVEFLQHEEFQYEERKNIICSAIDGILQVFQTPSDSSIKTPKHDFCRLFASAKVMYHLSKALVHLTKDTKDTKARQALGKVVTLMLLFSDSDNVVRQHVAERPVLQRILSVINKVTASQKVSLAKVIKNLSMEPATFETFEQADAIPVLVTLLGDSDTRIVNQTLNTLFNLCKVNNQRQEKAALAGVVPYLQGIIDNNSPLKHFALDMICDLSHTSELTRQELWKYNGVDYYIRLLEIDNWQDKALDSLAKWLKEDKKRVQQEMVNKANVGKIVSVFKTVPNRVFVKLIQPLQKILTTSTKLNKAFSDSNDFILVLKHALQQHYADAHVLLTQLRIIQSLYKYCDHPKRMVTDLYPILKDLVAPNNTRKLSSLAKSMAKELLQAFDSNHVV